MPKHVKPVHPCCHREKIEPTWPKRIRCALTAYRNRVPQLTDEEPAERGQRTRAGHGFDRGGSVLAPVLVPLRRLRPVVLAEPRPDPPELGHREVRIRAVKQFLEPAVDR